MLRGNPAPKLAITMIPDVHENILSAIARYGMSISAWMTMASREALHWNTRYICLPVTLSVLRVYDGTVDVQYVKMSE